MPIIQADEDSDMYGGGEAQDRRASPKQAKAMAEDMETSILPKSILRGKEINPGDKVILKVIEIGDEDFTVNYDKEDKGDKDKDEEEPDPVPEEVVTEEDDMDMMMS